MSEPDVVEIELPICHADSERRATEVLEAKRVGPDRYRLLYSPGMVEGLARDDEFELAPDDPKGFRVVKRSGYLCVWFYFRKPGVNRGRHGNRVRAEVARFGGVFDGGGNTNLVFAVPVSLGFPAIDAFFIDLARRYRGASWLYGNVYDPWDGFRPIGWWDA